MAPVATSENGLGAEYHSKALQNVRPIINPPLAASIWLVTNTAAVQLKDPDLFIRDAFINGQWVSKDKQFYVYG